MKKILFSFCIVFCAVFTGCTSGIEVSDGDGMSGKSFTSISQETAKEMMAKNDGHVVVDVRTFEEYQTGHIPGAVCIPNESIGEEKPSELPDPDQVILIYCRSGRRSKEAAKKLFEMGYRNVFEFGGILDWNGSITKNEAVKPSAVLRIQAGDRVFYANLEDNASAKAFTEKLESAPLTLNLSDYGSFEKVGRLPWSLPTEDARITTKPGDVILYQGDQITIYYDENTWSFTKLARIENATKESLLSALGQGDVTVTFSLEWSE